MRDKDFTNMIGKVADRISDGQAIAITIGAMAVGIIVNLMVG